LFVKIVLVVCGTAIAGFAQFADPFFTGERFTVWNVMGMAGAAVAGVGAIFLSLTEHDASKDLEYARAALETARDFDDEIAAFNRSAEDTRRVIELYTAMRAMRAVIEQIMEAPNVDSLRAIELCLEAARRSLLIAFGFEIQEHWTIAVYIAEKNQQSGKNQLRLIADERSIPCPEEDARIWPEGVGVAGVAYAKVSEVIVPNLLSPELGSAFSLGSLTKDEDNQRYCSIAAVPISLRPGTPPWGIVVATSNRPGHFDIGQAPGIQTAEALRALAGMLVLAIKITTVRTSPGAAATNPS
jgi:hypothetical protein